MNEIAEVLNSIWYIDKDKIKNLDIGKQFLNKIPVYISIFDIRDVKILWANKYFLDELGFTKDCLKKVSLECLIDLVDRSSKLNLINTLKYFRDNKNEVNTAIFKIKTPKNKWVWLLSRNAVYKKDPDGSNRSIISYATEINSETVRNQLEKLIKEEDDLRNIELIHLLSARERDILQLIVNGYTDKEISTSLNISIHTTKTHRKRIINKFNLKNTASLVKFAIENGLV
jgi:DNA-binding CsgD family transcriptional regulator